MPKSEVSFPDGARSLAQNMSGRCYAFNHRSVPFGEVYAVGLYLLAKSVYLDLTAEEYWRLGILTDDFCKGNGTIINPQRLIDKLKK